MGMKRVTGAASLSFALGAGAMSVLTNFLGPYSEPAALGLVGFALVGMSQILGSKPASADVPESETAMFSKAS